MKPDRPYWKAGIVLVICLGLAAAFLSHLSKTTKSSAPDPYLDPVEGAP